MMDRVRPAAQMGDAKYTGLVILKLADMKDPPLRIFFGKGPLDMARKEYADRLALWEKYVDLTCESCGLK